MPFYFQNLERPTACTNLVPTFDSSRGMPAVICAFRLTLGLQSIRVCEWTVITSVLISFPSAHAVCTCTWLIRLEQGGKSLLMPFSLQSKWSLHCLIDRVLERKKKKTQNRDHKTNILVLGLPFTGFHHGHIYSFLNLSFSICNHACLFIILVWE